MSTIEIIVPGGVGDTGGGPIVVVPNPPGGPVTPSFHISPTVFRQGQFLNVTLNGDGTFWDVSSVLSFSGSGITVHNTVTINPTQANAVLTVDFNAPLGSRDVVMTTGADIQTLLHGIEIMLGDPGWIPRRHDIKTYFRKPKRPARDKLAQVVHDLRERADEENLLRLLK